MSPRLTMRPACTHRPVANRSSESALAWMYEATAFHRHPFRATVPVCTSFAHICSSAICRHTDADIVVCEGDLCANRRRSVRSSRTPTLTLSLLAVGPGIGPSVRGRRCSRSWQSIWPENSHKPQVNVFLTDFIAHLPT